MQSFVVGNIRDQLRHVTGDLNKQCIRIGLKINMHEIKVTSHSLAKEQVLVIVGQTIEAKQSTHSSQAVTGDPNYRKSHDLVGACLARTLKP